MKSKDQRVPILLTRGLVIFDMNAGNGLAISLSVYLSLSKNDTLKKQKPKTKQDKTKSKTTKKKEKKNLSSEGGSRTSDLRRKRATRYPLRHGHFKC